MANFFSLALCALIACVICTKEFTGRNPQIIPCSFCAAVICRLCFPKVNPKFKKGMTQAQYSQMKRYNECFQFKCSTCTVKETCLNPEERPRKRLKCDCCHDGAPPTDGAQSATRRGGRAHAGGSQRTAHLEEATQPAPRRSGRTRSCLSQPAAEPPPEPTPSGSNEAPLRVTRRGSRARACASQPAPAVAPPTRPTCLRPCFNSSISINRPALSSPVDQPSPIDGIPSGPLTDLATPLDDLPRAALGRPSPDLFANSATDLQSPTFNFTSDQSSNREFPQAVIEDSVQREEPPPRPVPILPTWTKMDKALRSETDALFDHRGYKFTVRRRNIKSKTTIWRCTVRPVPGTKKDCPSNVKEAICKRTGESKYEYMTHHTCQPTKDLVMKVAINRQAKLDAVTYKDRPTKGIVEPIQLKFFEEYGPGADYPVGDNVEAVVVRKKSKGRPPHPTDLNFILEEDKLPEGFYRNEVAVPFNGTVGRHLVFATAHQLQLLSSAKRWYMDGTFKLTRDPFKQLFSIHAFIKKGENVKQVPLLYVIMTRRLAVDYDAVFSHIRNILPQHKVVEVVADFEKAMWKGFLAVFPEVKILGCSFHWTKAVFSQIKKLGLSTAYFKSESCRNVMRKLLVLNLLPEKKIKKVFYAIKRSAQSAKLKELCKYVENTWLKDRLWLPERWSVYGQPIRTNNDAEGWHNRLNGKVHDNKLNVYRLIELLSAESKLIPLQVELLSQKKLKRIQKKVDKTVQKLLFEEWTSYKNKTIDEFELLDKCTTLYNEAILEISAIRRLEEYYQDLEPQNPDNNCDDNHSASESDSSDSENSD